MDFVHQPEEAKKFGSLKWFKWNIIKHATVIVVFSPAPFALVAAITSIRKNQRGLREGTYTPNVIKNRYTICRSDDWLAESSPKKYLN